MKLQKQKNKYPFWFKKLYRRHQGVYSRPDFYEEQFEATFNLSFLRRFYIGILPQQFEALYKDFINEDEIPVYVEPRYRIRSRSNLPPLQKFWLRKNLIPFYAQPALFNYLYAELPAWYDRVCLKRDPQQQQRVACQQYLALSSKHAYYMYFFQFDGVNLDDPRYFDLEYNAVLRRRVFRRRDQSQREDDIPVYKRVPLIVQRDAIITYFIRLVFVHSRMTFGDFMNVYLIRIITEHLYVGRSWAFTLQRLEGGGHFWWLLRVPLQFYNYYHVYFVFYFYFYLFKYRHFFPVMEWHGVFWYFVVFFASFSIYSHIHEGEEDEYKFDYDSYTKPEDYDADPLDRPDDADYTDTLEYDTLDYLGQEELESEHFLYEALEPIQFESDQFLSSYSPLGWAPLGDPARRLVFDMTPEYAPHEFLTAQFLYFLYFWNIIRANNYFIVKFDQVTAYFPHFARYYEQHFVVPRYSAMHFTRQEIEDNFATRMDLDVDVLREPGMGRDELLWQHRFEDTFWLLGRSNRKLPLVLGLLKLYPSDLVRIFWVEDFWLFKWISYDLVSLMFTDVFWFDSAVDMPYSGDNNKDLTVYSNPVWYFFADVFLDWGKQGVSFRKWFWLHIVRVFRTRVKS